MVARSVLFLFFVGVIAPGCEEPRNPRIHRQQPAQPAVAGPQSVHIRDLVEEIRTLRWAKETVEVYGYLAKTECSNSRDGQEIYGQTRALHNSCITWLVTSLEKDGIETERLKELILQVDASRQTLVEWYQGNVRDESQPQTPEPKVPEPGRRPILKRRPIREWLNELRAKRGGEKVVTTNYQAVYAFGEFVGSLLGIVPGYLAYNAELKALEQQARREEIERISRLLEACECRPWSEL